MIIRSSSGSSVTLTLSVDGLERLSATDGAYRYGMGGLRIASAGRMSVGRFTIEDYA